MMTPRVKKILKLAGVAVPLLVMLGWMGALEYQLRNGTKLQLSIEGYDPRDLLSGHYVTYRVNYGLNPCPTGNDNYIPDSEKRCVCFDASNAKSVAKATWVGSCGARPKSCKAYLQGQCEWDRLNAGIERFYFPESRSTYLNVVPPDSTIIVSINSQGRGIVTKLLVGGKSLEQFFDDMDEKK